MAFPRRGGGSRFGGLIAPGGGDEPDQDDMGGMSAAPSDDLSSPASGPQIPATTPMLPSTPMMPPSLPKLPKQRRGGGRGLGRGLPKRTFTGRSRQGRGPSQFFGE